MASWLMVAMHHIITNNSYREEDTSLQFHGLNGPYSTDGSSPEPLRFCRRHQRCSHGDPLHNERKFSFLFNKSFGVSIIAET